MRRSCDACWNADHPRRKQIHDCILYHGEARLIGRYCRRCVRRFVARGWAIGLEIVPDAVALVVLALLLLLPLRALAQCNSAVQMSYSADSPPTINAVNGSVYTVVVDLGFFSGAFPAVLNRFSAELTCPYTSARFGCVEVPGVFAYAGDQTLTTDCPTRWTTGHGVGAWPGDVIFEANPPLVFTDPIQASDWVPGAVAVPGRHCRVAYQEQLVGGLPGERYRQVLGLRYHGEDAVCDDGTPGGNIDTNSIRMAP